MIDRPESICAPVGGAGLRLRILATSDLHAHLYAWDYFGDREDPASGLERTASLIAFARAEEPNNLLFDNGDFLQGSPLGECFAAMPTTMPTAGGTACAPLGDNLHPMVEAMNAVGYDAATLGNHEFSHGLDFLMRAVGGAAFPVVSANVARRLGPVPAADETLVARHAILERRFFDDDGRPVVVRIGVFGVCPPQVMTWEGERLRGRIELRGMVEAARAAAADLRAAGADVIVALSHSGIAAAAAADAGENISLQLAAEADVDAVIAGHTHLTFPDAGMAAVAGIDPRRGTLAGKPAVMPGFHGSHLGVIDLTLRRQQGRWRIMSHTTGLRALGPGGSVPDRVLAGGAAIAHRKTLDWVQRMLGQTPARLSSHFALLGESAALRLVAEVQAAHVCRALRGGPLSHLPVLSAVAPFKVGGRGGGGNYTDIPAGPLAMRHAADLYIHPNTICALRVTGAELKAWLERGAGIFRCISPGSRDAVLIDTAFPGFNFDAIRGLSWRVDLSRRAAFDIAGRRVEGGGGRIVDLRWQGLPLDPGAEFVLATNSYRAGGGGHFPATGAAARVAFAEPVSIRDLLVAHIQRGGVVEDGPSAAWDFVPMPGSSVLFDTAPAAADHLGTIARFRPEDLGPSPEEGFRRFRLWL